MNEYLTKDQFESVKIIFCWIHHKLDVRQKMSFDFIKNYVNYQKFGNQDKRADDGLRRFHLGYGESDDDFEVMKDTVDDFGDGLSSETDSDLEFINLNENLKKGKSEARGVCLGLESLKNNACVVDSHENNLNEFDQDTLIVPSKIKKEGFKSFEKDQEIDPINSQNLNSIFLNVPKSDHENPQNYLNFDTFQKHTIDINNTPDQIKERLSFGRNSFDEQDFDRDQKNLKKSSIGDYVMGCSREDGDSQNYNMLGVTHKEENLLSSKTLGNKFPSSYHHHTKIPTM